MAVFQYTSVDHKGKKHKGRIDAASSHEAKERLREQGSVVLSLSGRKKLFQKRGDGDLSKNDLVTFTTQLGQLLSAGVPLYESLLSLEEQYREEPFHHIILTLCDNIKAGTSLSQAMSAFPHSFNRLYTSMVAAGESVGALDTTLEKLSALLAKQIKIKKQIITALLYPLLLAGFSFLIIILLLTFVIPSLEMIFADREVNGFTHAVISFSHFLRHGWLIYLPLLGLTVASLFYALRQPRVKLRIHRQLLRTPLLKTLIVQTACARFCRTMGTLLEGGVTIIEALQISRKVMRHPLLEEVVERAEERIVQGSLLSHELKKSHWFPSLVPRMLAIGEEGGNTPLMLGKIADIYEEEVDKSLGRLTALAQPVILLVMGGIVGIIMLAVLLPLTDVNAFLSG